MAMCSYRTPASLEGRFGRAECAGGEQHDQRPDSLAAAHHDVLGYLGYQGDVAFEAVCDQPVDAAHIGIGRSGDFLEAGDSAGFAGYVHDRTDNA